MAALTDFNAPVEKPKLSDFFATSRQPKPLLGPADTSNVAAYSASLAPSDKVKSVYNGVLDGLAYGDREPVDKVVNEYDATNQEADYRSLVDIVADSSLTPEQRQAAITNFNSPGSNILKTFYERTANAAAMADSSEEDNAETDFVRIDGAAAINEVDAYNGWVQQQINLEAAKQDPSMVNKIKDVVELILPWVDQSINAQVSGQLFGENGEVNVGAVTQALMLLGENKAAIRNALSAMPWDQRQAMASKIIELVNGAAGPTAFTQNSLIQMGQLQSFLTPGGYSDGDRILDNMFSILDNTIFLTPFSRPIKGLISGIKGMKGGAAETAALKRMEQAMEAMKAPETVQAVDDVIAQVAPPSATDQVISSMTILDRMGIDQFNETRQVLDEHLNGFEDVSIERIISDMKVLDQATADEIMEVRQALEGVVGQRNAELSEMITPETLKATSDLISDRVLGALESIDDAPYSVFQEVRQVIEEAVTPITITKKGLSQDILARVNEVLARSDLAGIPSGKTAGDIKNFITANTRESTIRRRYVRTTVQPTSVSQAYKDVNPGKARIAHEAAAKDTTGQAAQALYGTTREEAMANDLLPEIGNADGTVRNKVSMDEALPTPDADLIRKVRESKSDVHLTPAEAAGARQKAKDEWRDIQGLYPRNEMSSINDTGRGVNFDVVYGPKDGGFSDPVQALVQAKFGLKKYGITDDQIEVLKKNKEGNYEVVTDYSKKGDYLIRVKNDYAIDPKDLDGGGWGFTESSTFWRHLDFKSWTAGRAGGLLQHLVPSTAIIDKTLIDAATVAADKSSWIMKKLIELSQGYAKRYKKLDSVQKKLVDEYIYQANALELPFNSTSMKSMGMSDDAVETVRAWKTTQDTMWHFENIDLNKTLNDRGYMKYVDRSNDTDLIVRPIHINQTGDVKRVFDGVIVRDITRKEVADIYEKGGTIAKTRGANNFEDDVFEYVIVDNHKAQSYLRAIRPEEPTLAYRHGYYTTRYTNPYYITKRVKGKNGSEYNQVIATAENRSLADAELARLRTTDPEGSYTFRGDLKKGSDEASDAEWESMVSNGRTAQRVRGKRLRSVSKTDSDLNRLYIESPEESLIRSIRSLSARVSHRDFIVSAKKRFLQQFGDLVTVKGMAQWPEDVRLIGASNAEAPLSRLKDARVTWRYIEAMDSGYLNLIDDVSKNFFRAMADASGRSKSWKWLEGPARKMEDANPSGWARKKAFRLLLASNPLRQLPIQAMQALPVILATNPLGIPRIASQMIMVNYLARGGDVNSFFKAVAKHSTGLTLAEAKTLAKNYELSGFEAAVNANSLIRDDGKALIERTMWQKTKGAIATPLNVTQKIGFETGENLLMRSIWLSEYDKLRIAKKGAEITSRELDIMSAKVRHLTLNMNKAGELPYNENSLSTVLQFFQAPHKAFAQVVMGHKGLTLPERMRLGTSYVLAFGIGATPVTALISNAIQNKGDNVAIEVMENGLFNMAFNKALSSIYGRDVGVDFSDSFRLLQLPNFFQFFSDIIGLRIGEALSASPSAGLVFGDNPRITRFVKSFARPFTVNNDRKPEEFVAVGKDFLTIFSGASNAFKGMYILEHQKQMSASGAIIDEDSNYVEGLMKIAGFATIDEVRYYALNEKTYKASQKSKDDIKLLITETSRRLATEGISNREQEYWVDMMAEAQRVYGNDPFYLEAFISELNYKATRGEYDLFTTLLNLAKFTDSAQFDEMLRTAPSHLTEEDKVILRDAKRMLESE